MHFSLKVKYSLVTVTEVSSCLPWQPQVGNAALKFYAPLYPDTLVIIYHIILLKHTIKHYRSFLMTTCCAQVNKLKFYVARM